MLLKPMFSIFQQIVKGDCLFMAIFKFGIDKLALSSKYMF